MPCRLARRATTCSPSRWESAESTAGGSARSWLARMSSSSDMPVPLSSISTTWPLAAGVPATVTLVSDRGVPDDLQVAHWQRLDPLVVLHLGDGRPDQHIQRHRLIPRVGQV